MEQLGIFLLGEVAVSGQQIGVPETIMAFRIVRTDPDRLAEGIDRLAVSPDGLVRIPEVSESRGPLRIKSHGFLKVKNSFIIAVMLGVQYSDVVVCQPVSLDH